MKIPQVSEKLAEETGWHIGDGSMNFYKQKNKLKGVYQLRGHIIDDKQHYIKRIKPLFQILYNLKINLREMQSTGVFGFQIWNNDLVKFKKKLGLPLGKKLDIAIPKIFLKNKRLKTAVLKGIFDTDGSIYLEKKNNKLYPRMYITTICPSLAKQLKEIFNELGLRATLYSELVKRGNRKKAFIITIRGERMFYKFIGVIKPQNPKHLLKFQRFLNSKDL
jgi:intein/homing endonuclease